MKKEVDNTFTEIPKLLTNMTAGVVVNGKEYKNIAEWYNTLPKKEGDFVITLNKLKFNFTSSKDKEIRIIV